MKNACSTELSAGQLETRGVVCRTLSDGSNGQYAEMKQTSAALLLSLVDFPPLMIL